MSVTKIATFCHENAEFNVYFDSKTCEFSFTVKRSYDKLKEEYGTMALFFVDDESYEDINEINNPLYVVRKVFDIVVDYIKSNNLKYFMFIGSSPKKRAVYAVMVSRLMKEIDGYGYNIEYNKFIFWKNAK